MNSKEEEFDLLSEPTFIEWQQDRAKTNTHGFLNLICNPQCDSPRGMVE